jgi:cytochrome c peroxidase
MSAEKVALGRRLFFEIRLSSTGRYSCATCHRPELAFTDARAHALGASGESVRRSAMSLANVAYNPAFTWGSTKVRSLESQMRQPLFNRHPVEMGLKDDGSPAMAKLSADAGYRAQFAGAFAGDGTALSLDHIIKAIAAFERTLISGRSPFDRYIFDDDGTAMPDSAKRGMDLFFSVRVGCVQCHSGLNFSGSLVYQGHESDAASFANNGLYPTADRGLFEVTHRAKDLGKFRVPTLRNIALTAPYMHDGVLPTLEAVLDHYARGGHMSSRQDPRIHPLVLSAAERADLIAFLASLTDREFVENLNFQQKFEPR